MASTKIEIIEAGDAGFDMSWIDKLDTVNIDADLLKEENGVIILPCRVGNMVYVINPSNPLHIWNLKVTGYHYSGYGKKKGLYICCSNNFGTVRFNCTKIGQTVFLTREQAEQALRGGENNG